MWRFEYGCGWWISWFCWLITCSIGSCLNILHDQLVVITIPTICSCATGITLGAMMDYAAGLSPSQKCDCSNWGARWIPGLAAPPPGLVPNQTPESGQRLRDNLLFRSVLSRIWYNYRKGRKMERRKAHHTQRGKKNTGKGKGKVKRRKAHQRTKRNKPWASRTTQPRKQVYHYNLPTRKYKSNI